MRKMLRLLCCPVSKLAIVGKLRRERERAFEVISLSLLSLRMTSFLRSY